MIRKLSEETHSALRVRAHGNKRSVEAEIRAVLDNAMMPETRSLLGQDLVRIGGLFDGVNLDCAMPKPPKPVKPPEDEPA